MEIYSASENGPIHHYSPDRVLVEKLKNAEQKINRTMSLLDSIVDEVRNDQHTAYSGTAILDLVYQIRKQLS